MTVAVESTIPPRSLISIYYLKLDDIPLGIHIPHVRYEHAVGRSCAPLQSSRIDISSSYCGSILAAYLTHGLCMICDCSLHGVFHKRKP